MTTDFAKIGVKLSFETVDDDALEDAIEADHYRTFDLAMWGWDTLIDPSYMLSNMICGQYDRELERRLAALKDAPDALLVPSGFTIVFPTVAAGRARVRAIVTAAHSDEQFDAALAAFAAARDELPG